MISWRASLNPLLPRPREWSTFCHDNARESEGVMPSLSATRRGTTVTNAATRHSLCASDAWPPTQNRGCRAACVLSETPWLSPHRVPPPARSKRGPSRRSPWAAAPGCVRGRACANTYAVPDVLWIKSPPPWAQTMSHLASHMCRHPRHPHLLRHRPVTVTGNPRFVCRVSPEPRGF